LVVAHQSLFADELSTYWIVAKHSLRGVLSLMYGTASIHHAEITPPLFFVASWLTYQLGHTPELLRLPSLVAGALSIPMLYLLGTRTVGRRAALVATAITALSPFMIYYSTEARAYGVMMLLVMVSTLAMLLALDTGRTRWWVGYAVASCAALWTHYTCAFVLVAQLIWLWWAHPVVRRPALLANLGVIVGYLPWVPGMINDWHSPTVTILSDLSPFSAHAIWIDLGHWTVGYPFASLARLTQLPGPLALVLLAAAAGLAMVGVLGRLLVGGGYHWAWDDRRVVIVGLALATPVCEAIISTFSTHVFGVRNLAASWPPLALAFAMLLLAPGRWMRTAAVTLALVAFVLSAVSMLDGRYQRPNYGAAAAYVDRSARAGDVVIDATGVLSPGPYTGFDVAEHRRGPVVRALAPAERDHPYGLRDPYVPMSRAVAQAVDAARGGRIFVVGGDGSDLSLVQDAGYRQVARHEYSRVIVAVYAPRS
jgi:4-amino-4-deoxy-L-arabinose transferase-like glycosyltransferase